MASSSSRRAHSMPVPVGPNWLVAGKRVEVATQGLHVDGKMRLFCLRAVNQQGDAFRHGRARAISRIGLTVPSTLRYVRHRGQLDAPRQSRHEFINEQFAALAYRRHAEFCTPAAFPDKLPGHDVGVVLHRRDQDFIASGQAAATRN